MKRCVLILVAVQAQCVPAAPAAAAGIYFDDFRADPPVRGNTGYDEVGFRKANGSIAYITDKTTGNSVTRGSRYGCLWGASFQDGAPSFVGACVGACSCDTAGPNRFSDVRSAGTQTLTLIYTSDPTASRNPPSIQPTADTASAKKARKEKMTCRLAAHRARGCCSSPA